MTGKTAFPQPGSSPPVIWSVADATGATSDGYRARLSIGGCSGRLLVAITMPMGERVATSCIELQEAIEAAEHLVAENRLEQLQQRDVAHD